MADCERLKSCPFFTGQMAAVADLMKKSFCFGDKMKCARYQVASAGGPVPGDLYPNDTGRAQRILHRS